ncbi:hypothetical protein HK104_009588, partial [Borealophlyctis nickersoniae]
GSSSSAQATPDRGYTHQRTTQALSRPLSLFRPLPPVSRMSMTSFEGLFSSVSSSSPNASPGPVNAGKHVPPLKQPTWHAAPEPVKPVMVIVGQGSAGGVESAMGVSASAGVLSQREVVSATPAEAWSKGVKEHPSLESLEDVTGTGR